MYGFKRIAANWPSPTQNYRGGRWYDSVLTLYTVQSQDSIEQEVQVPAPRCGVRASNTERMGGAWTPTVRINHRIGDRITDFVNACPGSPCR